MTHIIESNDKEVILKEFEALTASGEMFIIIFTGGSNPSTGESWCGDCVTAKPMMNRIKEKQTGMKII